VASAYYSGHHGVILPFIELWELAETASSILGVITMRHQRVWQDPGGREVALHPDRMR